jgi:DNA-binding FadR family transcriptional regulator
MREVTTTLCQLGVLESRPRRGTILRSFDPILAGEHLGFHFTVAGLNPADSWEARQIIEEAILPLVVRRITPAILDEIRKAIQRFVQGPMPELPL